jgi:hypothetical protein
MQLDFDALADGVVRNNMGVGGIAVQVRGTLRGDRVEFAETGQTLPVAGAPAETSGPWLAFAVEGLAAEQPTVLRWVGAHDAPR